MATKQARQLAPGDIVDIDGHALTVHHLFGFMGLVGIAWTDKSYDSVVREPHDLITVTHVNTIGGAL